MTHTATPAVADADLAPEIIERLNRIRLHADGLTEVELTRLVEQAFRNFHGINTDRLVRYLAATQQ